MYPLHLSRCLAMSWKTGITLVWQELYGGIKRYIICTYLFPLLQANRYTVRNFLVCGIIYIGGWGGGVGGGGVGGGGGGLWVDYFYMGATPSLRNTHLSISDWFYNSLEHEDVIKWKHFPRYWLFVRGIHRSPVKSAHKYLWRGALMFSLICARMNGWVN